MAVPLLDLKLQYRQIRDEVMKVTEDIYESQMFILGKRVEEFEKDFAEYCHSKYSVGVSSGLPGTSTYPVTGFGLLITGANTGTAQLRFRSETTAAITAKAGLTLVVEKIA